MGFELNLRQPHIFKVQLIGGDTTKSDVLTIAITALGFIGQGQAIQQSGAKVGDVICVSGDIGTASYALHHILDELNGDGNACPTALANLPTPLKTALQYPNPKVVLGQELVGYASAMIDVSDGLGQDLGHILKASGVGARVDFVIVHNKCQKCEYNVKKLFSLTCFPFNQNLYQQTA